MLRLEGLKIVQGDFRLSAEATVPAGALVAVFELVLGLTPLGAWILGAFTERASWNMVAFQIGADTGRWELSTATWTAE